MFAVLVSFEFFSGSKLSPGVFKALYLGVLTHLKWNIKIAAYKERT